MASMKTSKTAGASKRRSTAKDPGKSAGTTPSKAKLKQKSNAPKVRGGKEVAAVQKPTAASTQTAKETPAKRTQKKNSTDNAAPRAESPRPSPKVETAQEKKAARGAPREVAVGDRVPAFALPDHAGRTVRSDELRGKPYVLYFYPKDDTAGCTKEACDFNDDLAQFAALGVEIYGVSPDPVASHGKFRAKYGLGFSLLADVDKELSTAMGVYQMKKNYGREYMGVVRSTFLIDAEGKVAQAWRAVRVAGHVPAVLERARAL